MIAAAFFHSYADGVVERIADLAEDEIERVIRHPVQPAVYRAVSELVAALRTCEEAADYNEFQRLLFQQILDVETMRAAISRVRKRLRRGLQTPADAPTLPDGSRSDDDEAWRIEGIVYERAWRQLRSVGDALAWRVSGFNRRYIMAVSRNAAPGPMAGKAGLPYELGAVQELWDRSRHFALLHDLTNCLRIGDISEFTADGRILLTEIKKSGRADSKQVARMAGAVAAVNEGRPLPGTTDRLVEVDVSYSTQLSYLRDAVGLARQRGTVGMKVPGGRALTAAHLPRMAARGERGHEQWIAEMQEVRRKALRRARIDQAKHHLKMFTADWAARSPTAVPYAIYPLPPEDCAGLICDLVVAEIIMAPDELFAVGARHEMLGEVLLPPAHGELAPSQSLFRFRKGDRSIVLHAGVMAQLLGELLALDPFVEAISEVLGRPSPPSSPVLAFRNEQNVWR